MPIEKQQDVWECDCCCSREYEGGAVRDGWVKFDDPDEYEDGAPERTVVRVLCYHCLEAAKDAQANE